MKRLSIDFSLDTIVIKLYLVRFSTAALAAPVWLIMGKPRNISQTIFTIAPFPCGSKHLLNTKNDGFFVYFF